MDPWHSSEGDENCSNSENILLVERVKFYAALNLWRKREKKDELTSEKVDSRMRKAFGKFW